MTFIHQYFVVAIWAIPFLPTILHIHPKKEKKQEEKQPLVVLDQPVANLKYYRSRHKDDHTDGPSPSPPPVAVSSFPSRPLARGVSASQQPS